MEGNPQLKQIQVKIIDRASAKSYTIRNHYMKTFPNSRVCFGAFYNKQLSGVITFGYSQSTPQKIKKLLPNINEGEYIEMQRMNLLDVLGHNAESYVLGLIYSLFKKNTKIKVILTHSGGCKNDCGIVYQAAAWQYFGKEKCNDFYLTKKGEYKNIIAPMRFGMVPKVIKSKGGQAIGEYLYGDGELIYSFRYLYLYPLNKGLRKYLSKYAKKYPKDSANFRKGQKWINGGGQ